MRYLKEEIYQHSDLQIEGISPFFDEKNYITHFVQTISKIPDISKFVYIGDKNIESREERSENYLEIYCRCNSNKFNNKKIEVDLMFNDVTRSRIYQKHKTEFKVKSQFLSKVAHEFKNPLICINELINQIYSLDVFNVNRMELIYKLSLGQERRNSNKILKFLNRIKSISNYLIILIKDLDYLSQTQISATIVIEKKESNLGEIIEFCREIAKILLKKQNKSSAIKFVIEKSNDLPIFIFTDEWRLKQVLINLISNSVKFTLRGEIILKITTEENLSKLKFSVMDTGSGISQEKQKNLFKPYIIRSNLNNEMGTGLGLSIVRDITSKLGEAVQIESTSSGSIFWFTIPISDQEEKEIKTEESPQQTNIVEELENISLKVQSQIDEIQTKIAEHGYDKNKIMTNLFDRDYNLENLYNNSEKKLSNNQEYISEKSLSEKELFSGDSGIILKCKSRIFEDPKKIKVKTRHYSDSNIINIINRNFNIQNLFSKKEISFLNISDCYNFIIIDDEKLMRMSTIRMLKNTSDKLKIKINIIEGEDGIECLYAFYKLISQGIKISAIISDENMSFMNGSWCFQIIQNILYRKNLNRINFYLVSANALNLEIDSKGIKVFNKPLSQMNTEVIIGESTSTLS
jgi:signal transduction histidine kinase